MGLVLLAAGVWLRRQQATAQVSSAALARRLRRYRKSALLLLD